MECEKCPRHHARGFIIIYFTLKTFSEATKSRLRETYERVTTVTTTIGLSELIYYVFIVATLLILQCIPVMNEKLYNLNITQESNEIVQVKNVVKEKNL